MAGVNAQLRLVRRGCLRSKFHLVLQWLSTFANPELRAYGLHVDLAWFQATTDGYYHYGLLIYSVEEFDHVSFVCHDGESGDDEQQSRYASLIKHLSRDVNTRVTFTRVIYLQSHTFVSMCFLCRGILLVLITISIHPCM